MSSGSGSAKKRPRDGSKEKPALTLKILRDARKTAHSFSDLISKIKNDAQQVAPNGDLMKALMAEQLFKLKLMKTDHFREIQDLVKTLISTKHPVVFLATGQTGLQSLIQIINCANLLMENKHSANMLSPAPAAQLTAGDFRGHNNKDLCRLGAMITFERLLLSPRRIMISRLLNAIDKLVITREILLMALYFC